MIKRRQGLCGLASRNLAPVIQTFDSAIWPVLGVQMVDCGVKKSKSRGKNRENERGVGVNSFALTPCPTPSLFILLTSFCAIHTIWTGTGWALSNVWITGAKFLLQVRTCHIFFESFSFSFHGMSHHPPGYWSIVQINMVWAWICSIIVWETWKPLFCW